MYVRPTHITYYKRSNTCVNVWLILLLYVCVVHTHKLNLLPTSGPRRVHLFLLLLVSSLSSRLISFFFFFFSLSTSVSAEALANTQLDHSVDPPPEPTLPSMATRWSAAGSLPSPAHSSKLGSRSMPLSAALRRSLSARRACVIIFLFSASKQAQKVRNESFHCRFSPLSPPNQTHLACAWNLKPF